MIDHPQGTLLFDTGMGADPEVDAHYRPRRIELRDAIGAVGLTVSDIDFVANCHLHFDHCGGNARLGGIPVFVQTVELENARETPDYTLPSLIEDNRFEIISGAAEILSGVHLIPTPEHGRAPVADSRATGRSGRRGRPEPRHSNAVCSRSAVLARPSRAPAGQPLPEIPEWLDTLQQFDPRAVYFAHDHSVWRP